MLFPALLLTTISLLGFYLPPDSGERIGLQITIMLTFMVSKTTFKQFIVLMLSVRSTFANEVHALQWFSVCFMHSLHQYMRLQRKRHMIK